MELYHSGPHRCGILLCFRFTVGSGVSDHSAAAFSSLKQAKVDY